MPNKRAKGLKLVGGYVDKKVSDAFKAYAKSQGKNAADAMRDLIKAELKKKGYKVDDNDLSRNAR